MALDELRTKYPTFADIIQYEPIPTCKHCHGTGERNTNSKLTPLFVCMCVCVDHEVAEDAQTAMSQIASQMLSEMKDKRSIFDLMVGDGNLRCARCGRPKILQNMIHTRLYGYLCVCGSDEWEENQD